MKIKIGDSRKENFRTGGDIKHGEIFRIDNTYFICSRYDGGFQLDATVLHISSNKCTKLKYINNFSYEATFNVGDIISLYDDLIIDEIIYNPTLNWD